MAKLKCDSRAVIEYEVGGHWIQFWPKPLLRFRKEFQSRRKRKRYVLLVPGVLRHQTRFPITGGWFL